MDTQEQEYGRFWEAFTIEATKVEARYPVFQSYGGSPQWWDYWGNHYAVHPRWNPRGLSDIEYRNMDGKLHRIYGPAYISQLYNVLAWYKDGLRHREGGPAYIHNANMAWFYEDKLHNLEGPAVVEGGGPKQYWIMGARMSKKEYEKEIRRRKRKGLIK
jgi:hypothetical protein